MKYLPSGVQLPVPPFPHDLPSSKTRRSPVPSAAASHRESSWLLRSEIVNRTLFPSGENRSHHGSPDVARKRDAAFVSGSTLQMSVPCVKRTLWPSGVQIP